MCVGYFLVLDHYNMLVSNTRAQEIFSTKGKEDNIASYLYTKFRDFLVCFLWTGTCRPKQRGARAASVGGVGGGG